jgi:hypothetical protein
MTANICFHSFIFYLLLLNKDSMDRKNIHKTTQLVTIIIINILLLIKHINNYEK